MKEITETEVDKHRMEVRIRIIDTLEDGHEYTLEKAEGGSIIVDWKGSDRKDDLNIVGSTLAVTMAKLSREDGAYYDLFTGDETRYRVIMDLADESYTIWQGFLLPDSYSEPYSNSPILVDVVATDGLGRLKGKFLPEEFYEDEKSVIEILTECLKLTGVGLDIRFAPAIENSQNKDYDTIYIDTSNFNDNDSRMDAYAILEELTESMLCVVFQADNYWNIEGYNIREQRVYTTKLYSSEGVFIEEQEITRLLKDVTGTGRPDITMQPPYGLIEVTHERVPISFPEELSQESNDGWVIEKNSLGTIYATDWVANNDFYAKARAYRGNISERPDYYVYIDRSTDINADYFSLRKRPYIRKGNKYAIELEFHIIADTSVDETIQQYIDNGLWTDPLTYSIRLGYNNASGALVNYTLFSNFTEGSDNYNELQFNDSGDATLKLDFVAQHSGLLQVFMFGFKDEDNGIERVEIRELSIENLDFQENYVVSRTLNKDYTLKKEIELQYADDRSALSKSFRLQKIFDSNTFTEIEVPIVRQFNREGFSYAVVELEGANLIADNIDSVYNNGVLVDVLDSIYNYNNSEEHAIKLNAPIATGGFTVRIFEYNDVIEDRSYWEEWSDSLYAVERLRYNEVVMNVFDRLFSDPIPVMNNLRVKNNIKINDFIGFDWRDTSVFNLTNCKWDVDKGFSDVSASKAYYGVEAGQNLPPVVEAGNDIQIGAETQFQLTSEGYDPDGFIVSYQWVELTSTGATINAPNSQNTNVTNFTEDFATFEVTVTDNEGATGSDTVNVYRVQNHELILTETVINSNTSSYEVGFNPNISEGASLNIRGTIHSITDSNGLENEAETHIRISINGTVIRDYTRESVGGVRYTVNDTFSVNYFNGDSVVFELYAYGFYNQSGAEPEALAEFTIDTIDFVEGDGTITNLPETRTKQYE